MTRHGLFYEKEKMNCKVNSCKSPVECKQLCVAHYNQMRNHGRIIRETPRNHGHRWSPTYRSWLMLRNRCNNKNATDYAYYGAKGVRVCERWNYYLNFIEDMGERPFPGATLDRIDATGNYCKENCRWATRKQQAQSRKYCKLNDELVAEMRLLYVAGMTQAKIAEKFGVGKTTCAYAVTGRSWKA